MRPSSPPRRPENTTGWTIKSGNIVRLDQLYVLSNNKEKQQTTSSLHMGYDDDDVCKDKADKEVAFNFILALGFLNEFL